MIEDMIKKLEISVKLNTPLTKIEKLKIIDLLEDLYLSVYWS